MSLRTSRFWRAAAALFVLCGVTLAALSLWQAPRARANTSGGSGDYKLVLTTCSTTDAATINAVYLTIQGVGGDGAPLTAGPMLLANGGDRRVGSKDEYAFSWPTGIGGPANLKALSLHIDGSDEWCVSDVELLSDSLWGGLDQLAADKIAIVWPAVHVGASPELETAVRVLEDVSQSLADPNATAGNPKQVAVVIT